MYYRVRARKTCEILQIFHRFKSFVMQIRAIIKIARAIKLIFGDNVTDCILGHYAVSASIWCFVFRASNLSNCFLFAVLRTIPSSHPLLVHVYSNLDVCFMLGSESKHEGWLRCGVSQGILIISVFIGGLVNKGINLYFLNCMKSYSTSTW